MVCNTVEEKRMKLSSVRIAVVYVGSSRSGKSGGSA